MRRRLQRPKLSTKMLGFVHPWVVKSEKHMSRNSISLLKPPCNLHVFCMDFMQNTCNISLLAHYTNSQKQLEAPIWIISFGHNFFSSCLDTSQRGYYIIWSASLLEWAPQNNSRLLFYQCPWPHRLFFTPRHKPISQTLYICVYFLH